MNDTVTEDLERGVSGRRMKEKKATIILGGVKSALKVSHNAS